MKRRASNTSSTWLISVISGLLGVGLILLAVFWGRSQFYNSSILDEARKIFQAAPTATQDSRTRSGIVPSLPIPNLNIQTIITPASTPEWMVYDGIDLRDKEVDILFSMRCDQDTVYLEPFRIVPYSPEIMQDGEFSSNLNLTVAWEHLGYYGLWIHSGLAYDIGVLTAYPLQIIIEKDAQGNFRTPNEVRQYLEECLSGAEMRMHQGDSISVNTIVAAVRVPPVEVNELSQHAMDLVPYLAKTYPGSGFEEMTPPGLIFYFCGQQLMEELGNPNENEWTQARFIIGVMPVLDK